MTPKQNPCRKQDPVRDLFSSYRCTVGTQNMQVYSGSSSKEMAAPAKLTVFTPVKPQRQCLTSPADPGAA